MDEDDAVGAVADESGATAGKGPKAARQAAQDLEFGRVTVGRVVRTLVRVMHHRNWRVLTVGGESVPTPESVARAVATYENPARAKRAEEQQEVVMTCMTDKGGTAMVALLANGNVETMRDVQQTLESSGIAHALLVARNKLTHNAKKMLMPNIEFFTMASLQACIADHKLVPKHVVLDEAARARVRRRYASAKYPRLLMSDPMARLLNVQPGDVVMVHEKLGLEQPMYTFLEVIQD